MSIKVVLILAAVLLDFLFGMYVGHLGIEVKDEKHVVANQAQEIQRTTNDTKITSDEGKSYAAAVAKAIAEPDPAPAVVCVRRYAVPVAASSAAGPGPHDQGGLPAGDYRPVQPVAAGGTDIGKPATVIGARATAKVAGLQDYITRVCLSPN